MASIVKRNNRYCVVYTYKHTNGTLKQKWETFTDLADAKNRKKEVEYKESVGTFVAPQCRTLKDLLKEYVTLYGRTKWALSTYQSNTALISNYIEPLIGSMKLQDLTTRVIEGYYQRLLKAASGRPLYTLETMFPDLLEEIILIGDNGGAARWKGKDLFVSEMPAEGWRQLARSTKQAGDVGLLCGLQAAYAEKQDEKYDKVFKNFYTRVEYVDDLTAVEAAADKFTVYLPNDDSQKAFDRTYGAFHTGNGGAFSVAVAGRNWVDVMNPGVHKGAALAKVGALLGIPADSMMAFGDTYNDAEMLTTATPRSPRSPF